MGSPVGAEGGVLLKLSSGRGGGGGRSFVGATVPAGFARWQRRDLARVLEGRQP